MTEALNEKEDKVELVKPSTRVDESLTTLATKVRELVIATDKNQWAAGDLINEYRASELERTSKEPSYKLIADAINIKKWTRGWIQRLAVVAKHFASERRCENWTWYDHYSRYRVEMRRRKTARSDVADIKDAVDGLGITNSREVSRVCADKSVVRKGKQKKVEACERLALLKDIVGKIHLGDWQEMIRQLPGGSISVMFADPPFGRLGSYFEADRRHQRKFALGYECANCSPEDAMKTTLPLFDHADKFTSDGVIIMLQEGGRPLHPKILARARRRGWEARYEIHAVRIDDDPENDPPISKIAWPAPSFIDDPSGPVETKIVVFVRKGCRPERFDNGDNRNVIFWRSLSRSATQEVRSGQVEEGYRHVFEFPPETVEKLLRRFLPTHTRQLVVEPFACTAPACIAAMRNGWTWVGTELEPENQKRGVQRIKEERDEGANT